MSLLYAAAQLLGVTQMITEAQQARDPAQVLDSYLNRLEGLAEVLGRRGLRTSLMAPPGRVPSLHVVNPAAPALAEHVYAGPRPGRNLVVLVVVGGTDRGGRGPRGRRFSHRAGARGARLAARTAAARPARSRGSPGNATVLPRQYAARSADAWTCCAPNVLTAGVASATRPR